jgi:hypothetical protein
MSTDKPAETVRQFLRSWRRRKDSVDAERDGLVMTAVEVLSKEEVHVLTGISRSTIDRILSGREE